MLKLNSKCIVVEIETQLSNAVITKARNNTLRKSVIFPMNKRLFNRFTIQLRVLIIPF